MNSEKTKHGLVATEISIVWYHKGSHILEWASAPGLPGSLSSAGVLQICELKYKNTCGHKNDIAAKEW
jgi:hypothetical protein